VLPAVPLAPDAPASGAGDEPATPPELPAIAIDPAETAPSADGAPLVWFDALPLAPAFDGGPAVTELPLCSSEEHDGQHASVKNRT
jgi:hypothetical protein